VVHEEPHQGDERRNVGAGEDFRGSSANGHALLAQGRLELTADCMGPVKDGHVGKLCLVLAQRYELFDHPVDLACHICALANYYTLTFRIGGPGLFRDALSVLADKRRCRAHDVAA